MKKTIELPIEKIAGLGDGLGFYEGHRIFVPYTAAGDRVRTRIAKELTDAWYGELEEVLTPSGDRIVPFCRHFGQCGGCALQHVTPQVYREFKHQMAREAVRKAGFPTEVVGGLMSINADSRRRVELKIVKGTLGYYARQSHRLIALKECKVLEPGLEALVLHISETLAGCDEALTAVQINQLEDGYDLVWEAEHRCDVPNLDHKAVRRVSLRVGQRVTLVMQIAPVQMTLGRVVVDIPPGAFLQASAEAQRIMTAWVMEAAAGCARILDLFAGVGTYSFPLAERSHVTAIEGERSMVDAMLNAAKRHHLTQFTALARDLMGAPLTPQELTQYGTVIINPPRTGARQQCEALAQARVARVVMVSCNAATFARDGRILQQAGYQLRRLTPVDQFVYSPHLELLAEFECK